MSNAIYYSFQGAVIGINFMLTVKSFADGNALAWVNVGVIVFISILVAWTAWLDRQSDKNKYAREKFLAYCDGARDMLEHDFSERIDKRLVESFAKFKLFPWSKGF